MAFVSMLIGIINGTGFGTFFSGILQPLLGSIPGLLVLGIICSIPGLSAILGPGAVISQILGGIMGAEIAAGRISPSLALVGLFALNCHAACDFIPVGLGLAEAQAGSAFCSQSSSPSACTPHKIVTGVHTLSGSVYMHPGLR